MRLLPKFKSHRQKMSEKPLGSVEVCQDVGPILLKRIVKTQAEWGWDVVSMSKGGMGKGQTIVFRKVREDAGE